MGTIIESVASYKPGEVVKSSDLLEEINSEIKFGVSHNWIGERVGIFERRFSWEHRPSDLAIIAANQALAESGTKPIDIDVVIYCGIDKDYEEPSTAHNVQHAIGAANAHSFDVSNACHGFLNAIHIVDSLFKTGDIKHALVCTGEQPSKITKEALRKLNRPTATRDDFRKYLGGLTCGDAGAAMLLRYEDTDRGFTKFNIKSLPEHAELCYYKKTTNGIDGVMVMDKICKAFLTAHENLLDETIENTGFDKIDYLITHQVGKRPHERFAKMTNLPMIKVPATYPKRGNITSATIPTVLTELLKICNTTKHKNFLFFGVGSGITISQSLYKG